MKIRKFSVENKDLYLQHDNHNISVIQGPRSRSKVRTQGPNSKTRARLGSLDPRDLRTRPYNISVIQGPRSRSKVRTQGPGPDLEV